MTPFHERNGALHCEGVPLAAIAEDFGTPCYVYSRAALEAAFREYDDAFARRDHLICYALKANSNLALIGVLAKLGAGFDIVSGGELRRVLAAGGSARRVVFSGVGKTADEIALALESGILCFNVESTSELLRINDVATRLGRLAPVSLRVNPDVDAQTHPYISTGLKENKFGVAFDDAFALYRMAAELPSVHVTGIDCHIGSQLTEVAPFVAALERVLGLVDRLEAAGIHVEHIDLGGGLGIRYRDELPPPVAEYADALIGAMHAHGQKIILEPGRSLVGNAGLLLTRVEYLKHSEHKNFVIVDAAMNDLMRPSLYDAHHGIVPVVESARDKKLYDVVGPICESGDFLGRSRMLGVEEGDLLAILSAGAYGMSMSSNYNSRPRAAEVLVDGDAATLVRERESVDDLFRLERPLA